MVPHPPSGSSTAPHPAHMRPCLHHSDYTTYLSAKNRGSSCPLYPEGLAEHEQVLDSLLSEWKMVTCFYDLNGNNFYEVSLPAMLAGTVGYYLKVLKDLSTPHQLKLLTFPQASSAL